MMPANTYNGSVFITSYSYGLNGKEYVFSCKGRPCAALVSPHLPTPTSSLLDYDLVKKLVISDLYQMMDTHCVAGAGMQEKLAHLAGSEESDEELFTNIDGSSTTTAMIPSSLPTAAMMSSSYTPLKKMKF